MQKIEPYKGIAGIYEEVRPSYPEELIHDIIIKTGIKVSDRLLEIGAGTGKATIQFAEKGFQVQAIEIGEDMAVILKDKCAAYPNVSVEVMSFEDWDCSADNKYDMIFSAQAFHWLDKNTKYSKCHELLSDNGYLVLFWYNPLNEKLLITKEIDEKVNDIVEKYVSDYNMYRGNPERRAHDGVSDNDERRAEIEASGLFELVEKIEYSHEICNNPWQYLLAMKSVPALASVLDGLESQVIENMDSEIIEVVNKYGGYVTELFKFSLYICKKIPFTK